MQNVYFILKKDDTVRKIKKILYRVVPLIVCIAAVIGAVYIYQWLTHPVTAGMRYSSSQTKTAGELREEGEAQLQQAKSKLKPMMGWSAQNIARGSYNAQTVAAQCDILVNSGLSSAGYKFISLTNGWQSSSREGTGLLFNRSAFDDISGFIKKIKDMGLSLAIYSTTAETTAVERPGSWGYEDIDAKTFREWGIGGVNYSYYDFTKGNNVYTTKAPSVKYLLAKPSSSNASIHRYEVSGAEFIGNAKLSKGVLIGIDKNIGAVIFTVKAKTAGKYLLTLGYNEPGDRERRFALAVVNPPEDGTRESKNEYELWLPVAKIAKENTEYSFEVTLQSGDNKIKIYNPIESAKDDVYLRLRRMGEAVKTAYKDETVYFSVFDEGVSSPWEWAGGIANSWQVGKAPTGDWKSVMQSYEKANSLWSYQRPGNYNDPGELCLGSGTLTAEESRSHFSLWCILSAPLILSNDLTRLVEGDGSVSKTAEKGIYDIISNMELIALNQDDIMLQSKLITTVNNVDILVKPLSGGEAAVLFLNKSDKETSSANINLSELAKYDSRVTLPGESSFLVKNLWETEDYYSCGAILESGQLESHAVSVFRVKTIGSGLQQEAANFTVGTKDSSAIFTSKEKTEFVITIENRGKSKMENISAELIIPLDGARLEGSAMQNLASLDAGESHTFIYSLTVGEYESTKRQPVKSVKITGRASFSYSSSPGEPQQQTFYNDFKIASTVEASETFVSDMPILYAHSELGPVTKNRSAGGIYMKFNDMSSHRNGMSSKTPGEFDIYLGGDSFNVKGMIGSDIKTDDEVKLQFIILADGREVYRSKETESGDFSTLDINVNYCRIMTFKVISVNKDGKTGIGDWVDLRVKRI